MLGIALGIALVVFCAYGMILNYPHPLAMLWGMGMIVALVGWKK